MIVAPKRDAAARAGIPSMSLRPREHHFHGRLGRFATGVAIVTFDGVTKRHGITANSFTSVSMEPPLVLVSIARSTTAHDELDGRPFSVNILGAEQRALAMHFAGKPGNEPVWNEGEVAPRLDNALGFAPTIPESQLGVEGLL